MYKYINKNIKPVTSFVALFLIIQSMVAQIGINTENIPANALFVVDGARDNPATGAIGRAEQANDIVVTHDAVTNITRMGIGTHNPEAKLDITTNGAAGIRGFRMDVAPADLPALGLAGHVVKYMSDGTAKWQPQARTATPVNVNITDGLALPLNVNTTLTGTGLPFTAPIRAAFFGFEIRFWAEVTGIPSPIPNGTQLPRYALLISLVRTRAGVDTVVDRFRFTSFGSFRNSSGVTSSVTLYARTQASDVYNVKVQPITIEVGTLRMRPVSAGWTTSKIRIIELQAENDVELH